MSARITNAAELDTTPLRHAALGILQAALDAIDTDRVVRSAVSLTGEILHVRDAQYDLSRFKRIRVIGFGKASCRAAATLADILGERVVDGAVIGLETVACGAIATYQGTHPTPTPENVAATRHLVEVAETSGEDDLVVIIVSGGGSSLLVWPESELHENDRLYEAATSAGATINQLNVMRKHLSLVKGGGLAKLCYPATVAGLIFSDVPGTHDDMVASGPTFPDPTTVADAEQIARELGLGAYPFTETPKDPCYFERVRNITLVSNVAALDAMAAAARAVGFTPNILTAELYDHAPQGIDRMFAAAKPKTAIIAGGELSLEAHPDGSGGRNLYASMLALQRVTDHQLFTALASDGLDNSDVAGAIADAATRRDFLHVGIDAAPYIAHTDAYRFFEQVGNRIMTGPTEANVSDLYLLLTA